MAAAKKRPSPAPRFPYSARDREGGGAYAETANGRELLFTGPAAEKAKNMAQRRYAASIRPLDLENPYGAATAEPSRVERPLEGGNPYTPQAAPALDRSNPYAPVEPSPLEEANPYAREPQIAPQPAARPQRAPARAQTATAAAGSRPAPRQGGETILASYGTEPGPAVDPTFDAHAYQMAAEAANPFAMPRTARGSLRDLAPTDASPEEAPATYDAAMSSAPSAAVPTLAEVQESRAYATPSGEQWDTVYRDPKEERRRKVKPAAQDKARVRHAEDVKFYDPEKPVYL
jgi:hypothetical protein